MRKILEARGISQKNWDQILTEIESKLEPELFNPFTKLYRNFISYTSKANVVKFYNFLARHHIIDIVQSYRVQRIESIWPLIQAELNTDVGGSGQNFKKTCFLEVGCGSGVFSEALLNYFSQGESYIEMHVYDISPDVMSLLKTLLPVHTHVFRDHLNSNPKQYFDYMLCIDSLGEINSDDSGELESYLKSIIENPGNQNDLGDFAELLEAHYGLGSKVSVLLPWLKVGGKIFFTEPFNHLLMFEGAQLLFEKLGFSCEIIGASAKWPTLLVLKKA